MTFEELMKEKAELHAKIAEAEDPATDEICKDIETYVTHAAEFVRSNSPFHHTNDLEGTAPVKTLINGGEAVAAHTAANDSLGRPVQHWTDKDGYLCISWSCGRWWHYARENGEVVWW